MPPSKTFPRLRVQEQGTTRFEVALYQMPFLIGSSPQAHLRIEPPDLQAEHARIELREGATIIRSCGSVAKVLVNRCPFVEKALTHGDLITLCVEKEKDEILDGLIVFEYTPGISMLYLEHINDAPAPPPVTPEPGPEDLLMGDVAPMDDVCPVPPPLPEFELPIEKCEVTWQFKCPLKWQSLGTTPDPAVRFCSVCERTVHLCRTPEELRAHAGQRHCVAFSGK